MLVAGADFIKMFYSLMATTENTDEAHQELWKPLKSNWFGKVASLGVEWRQMIVSVKSLFEPAVMDFLD